LPVTYIHKEYILNDVSHKNEDFTLSDTIEL